MKRLIIKFAQSLLFLFILDVPLFVYAENTGAIQDPLTQKPVVCLLRGYLNGIYSLGLVISVLAIAYSGFMFVQARNNPHGLDDAKRNFFRVIVGVSLFVGSWLIGVTLANVLNLILPGTITGIAAC